MTTTKPPHNVPSREEIAREITGPHCDVSGGEHTVAHQGKYAFCKDCGETIRKSAIGSREALKIADCILAKLNAPSEGPKP